jgi:hypothetical protein
MNQMFVPLETVSQLSQGKVYEDFMDKLAKVQDGYIKHLRKYGVRAANQKAKISMIVEFSTDVESVSAMVEDGEPGSIDIACSIKVGLPDPPAYTSQASVGDADGRDALFVQRGGSKMDSPQQRTFLTDDGQKRIDVETGEILEEAQA